MSLNTLYARESHFNVKQYTIDQAKQLLIITIELQLNLFFQLMSVKYLPCRTIIANKYGNLPENGLQSGNVSGCFNCFALVLSISPGLTFRAANTLYLNEVFV